MKGDATNRGFTLLEVLVAFAIAALGLGVALQAMGGGLAAGEAAANRGDALLLAQSRLAEATVLPPEARTGRDAGLDWRSAAEPLGPASDGGLRLYRYEAVVTGADGVDVRLVTVRLRAEP
ncbi:MAG: prepilin-type N-terminal cleavage/methylation domain-containing protein [Alphaproteobacteria bacterium]